VNLLANSQTVKKAEYFFDTDNGFGAGTQVTLTQSADSSWQLPTITTSSLSRGYHRLYIRTRDSNNKWGQTSCMNVEIIHNNTQVMDSIITAEYFIDTDPKFGKGKVITVTPHDSSIATSFTIPASEFTSKSVGRHIIYGRVRNNLGRWSETFKSRIELLKNESTTSIAKVEFFFIGQNDDGFGLNNSKSFSPVFIDDTVTFNIPYNQLQFHANDTLFLRVRDNVNNRWSETSKITGLNITVVGPRLAEVIQAGSFSLYPNPASDHITVNLDQDLTEPMSFTLTNSIGEVVGEQMIENRETRINFNQPPGIYFVNLKNYKENFTRKIVLQ
jgi:hypothetical protein